LTSPAQRAVNEIVRDLRDRQGLGDQWDSIDTRILSQIRAKWRKIINEALRQAEAKKA
jgi:hypothetical protein